MVMKAAAVAAQLVIQKVAELVIAGVSRHMMVVQAD